MPRRLPRSLAWTLLALALSSFAVGVVWEARALDHMQQHPYLVNVLSGMTGFATSALVITLGVDRVLRREHLRRWGRMMGQAVGRIQADLMDIVEWHLSDGRIRRERHRYGYAEGLLDTHLLVRTLVTVADRGGLRGPVDRHRLESLLRVVDELLAVSVPAFERAFDVLADPAVERAVAEIRHGRDLLSEGVDGDPAQVDTRALLLGSIELVRALTAVATYRPYRKMVLRRQRLRGARRAKEGATGSGGEVEDDLDVLRSGGVGGGVLGQRHAPGDQ
ncbi:hypothetical protein [Micromonospora sediminimaris]|uniref:Uncharacterized protein n=1 Tax=Micromonospora sediminimaris TaxID=547162 RepID=A0A9W5XI92_9ACTN|nr:hypothetical protein [Micromonospora sediminimaris]GIJ32061.1 hypothetical protein Vse01_12090 [Micromonospora sediminimaris]SFC68697.1 hypothetical protein SAMN05216284_106251 [Micromonospora sediminimaris]